MRDALNGCTYADCKNKKKVGRCEVYGNSAADWDVTVCIEYASFRGTMTTSTTPSTLSVTLTVTAHTTHTHTHTDTYNKVLMIDNWLNLRQRNEKSKETQKKKYLWQYFRKNKASDSSRTCINNKNKGNGKLLSVAESVKSKSIAQKCWQHENDAFSFQLSTTDRQFV